MGLIAIPLKQDTGMDSEVNPHFSRSDFFIFIDDKNEGSFIEKNPAAKVPGHEETLVFLSEKGVDRVLCSGMGTPALLFAKELGIEVCYGRAENAARILEMYNEGLLENMQDGSPCSP